MSVDQATDQSVSELVQRASNQAAELVRGEILPAAALQGAIFAFVKAAVDRGGAEGFRKMTGVWPGE